MTRTPHRSRQTRKLLAAMLEKPLTWRYGYELLKITGLQSGTLYPALLRLSDSGLLEAQWREADKPGRPPRHVYRLTSAGLAYAREQAAPVRCQPISLLGAKA
ncbi:MAG TPA: helix-turn-helix transcriptional regulator [Rhizomicrobium sp.]|jgi:DNA-binding PadR family transcriptional regulator